MTKFGIRTPPASRAHGMQKAKPIPGGLNYIARLAKVPAKDLKNLGVLDLRWAKITNEGLSDLSKALPNCLIARR